MKQYQIGIIGGGERIASIMKYFKMFEYDVQIKAIADPYPDTVKEKMDRHGADISNAHFYSDAVKMLDENKLDGVMIGTRCNLHTGFALEVMKRNIPLFLEKPVCIHEDEAKKLAEANKKYKGNSVVSFPLRHAEVVLWIKNCVDAGRIGKIVQVQAYNNVHYGRIYYKTWYRDDQLTNGLFLQKATHDVDYINYILGMQPTEVCAVESKVYMKGNKPVGLKCSECDEYRTCKESTFRISKEYRDTPFGEGCCFAVDTGNQDSGTLIMSYENGTHTVYTQNFLARHMAAKRGARFIGETGTVEFDFNTGKAALYSHTAPTVETLQTTMLAEGHAGGEFDLIHNFIGAMEGKKCEGNLDDGIASARICLAAERSAKEHKFVSMNTI